MIALILAAGLTVADLPPDNDPCYALDRHGVAYRPASCERGGVYWPLPITDSSDFRRGFCAGFNVAAKQSEVGALRFKKLMAAAGPEKPDPKRPGQVIYDQAKELAALGIDMYAILPPIPCDSKTGRTSDGE